MMSRTHIAIGIAAGAAAAHALHVGATESIGVALVAGAGATLPDIDTEQSTASRMLFKLVPLIAICYIVFGMLAHLLGWSPVSPSLLRVGLIAASIMLLPTITHLIFGHRGATHSLLVWIVLLGILYAKGGHEAAVLLGASVCFGICAGGILPDAITPAGVPLFWPITGKRIHLLPEGLRMRTGGLMERILVRPLAYLAIVMIALRLAGLL